MDVRLPDGTIVRNVPEGITKSELMRRIERKKRSDRIASLAEKNPAEFDPTSPEFKAKFGPALPGFLGGVENFFAGAGKATVDLGRGVRQLGVEAANVIPGVDLDERAEELRQESDLVRRRDAPLMGTGAGLTGAIAGNLATTLLPAAGLARGAQAANLGRTSAAAGQFVNPTTFGAGALSGAIQGGIAPVGEGDSRSVNTLIGGGFGLAGQALTRGAQRLVQPFKRALSPRAEQAADLLRREGVSLDVPQRTGSEGAQKVRSALFDNPLTTSRQVKFAENQSRQFTRAVLRTVGADADEVTPRVLNKVRDDIGNVIDTAAKKNPAFIDTQLAGDIQSVRSQISRSVGDQSVENALNRNIDHILEKAANNNGFIPGDVFVDVRSTLSKLSTKTPLARDIEEALLNALDRAGGSSSKLKDALAKFRNLTVIENSIDKGVDKIISPMRLSNTLGQKRNRALSLRNLGHPRSQKLARLAEAGRTFLPETIGQSGTTPRALIGEGLLAAGGFGGALATGQDVESALGIGVGAATLPLLIQKGLLNQGKIGNFLSQGLDDPVRSALTSEQLRLLLQQGSISGGLIGSR